MQGDYEIAKYFISKSAVQSMRIKTKPILWHVNGSREDEMRKTGRDDQTEGG